MLCFAGVACAFGGSFGPIGLVIAATLVTALHVATGSARGWIRWLARLALLPLYVVWTYLAAVFGWLLGWTVPWPMRVVLVLLALVAVLGFRVRIAGVRVPPILPLGIWLTLVLIGWKREDGVLRCDDYARFLTDPAVTLALPTTTALSSCTPGETLHLARYPRRVWEAPDATRYFVTTQPGANYFPYGTPVPDPLDGGVCEFGSDGTRRGCVAAAFKTQLIFDAERLDEVIVGGWNGNDGGVYALPRSGPLRVLREARTETNIGEGYYDPDADEIGLLDDGCWGLTRFRASDFSPLPRLHAPFCPGEAHYDPIRHEGIICFAAGPMPLLLRGGSAVYLSAAVRGDPFSYRLLGTSPLAYAALVWGCDFDPVHRVAWAAIANLPLIAAMDYDTGRLTATWWAEPGLRSAAFDAARRRLYVANFLRGDVSAFDVDTGQRVGRWFVGRFARYVALTRDRSALLATSNLGVVRITLSPLADAGGSHAQLP